MLRAFTCDLGAAGHKVSVLLDSRLRPLRALLGAERAFMVESKGGLLKNLKEAAGSSEAAYVIAPESGGTLASLVESIEEGGIPSLNCAPEAIRSVADKAEVYSALPKIGLNVPETIEADAYDEATRLARIIKDIGLPVVFKPVDGAGCSGLSLVKRVDQVPEALKRLRSGAGGRRFLVQKFVHGVSASVSVIAAAGRCAPLSLNRQIVRLAPPDCGSSYEGGLTPLEHPLRHEVFEVVKRAVGLFGGLRGYVGVDLVLTRNNKVYIMEINPRLTTSYVGLRRVISYNPAQAIIDAALYGRLPPMSPLRGFAAFRKVKMPSLGRGSLARPVSLENVLTPPLPLGGGGDIFALIEAYGLTLRSALSKLYRVKRKLIECVR